MLEIRIEMTSKKKVLFYKMLDCFLSQKSELKRSFKTCQLHAAGQAAKYQICPRSRAQQIAFWVSGSWASNSCQVASAPSIDECGRSVIKGENYQFMFPDLLRMRRAKLCPGGLVQPSRRITQRPSCAVGGVCSGVITRHKAQLLWAGLCREPRLIDRAIHRLNIDHARFVTNARAREACI